MRRFATIVSIVTAGLLGASVALAATPSGVNLNGKFSVAERLVRDGNIVGVTNGETYHYTWSFAPRCGTGACASAVEGPYGLHMALRPQGGDYAGSGIFLGNCYEFAAPHSLIATDVYDVHYQTTITPRRVVRGAALSFAGTLVENWRPTSAGRAHNCSPAFEIWRLVGTAIAGTVHEPLPAPQPRPAHHPGPGARSTIASSLVPAGRAFPANGTLLLDAILALLAMLFITFPAQIFNRTLDENYAEIKQIVDRRMPHVGRLVRSTRRYVRVSPVRSFLLVYVAGSLIGCFNDPTFGFNATSARTLLSVLLAFAIGIAVSAGVGWAYRRARGFETRAAPHALPVGLAVGIGCVLVSRLTHFEPGYLYGIVVGVAFTTVMGTREKGHEAGLVSLATLAVSVGAWLLWSAFHSTLAAPGQSFPVLIADTLLASLFVAGIVNTLVGLIPVESMVGHTVFRWHKGAWAALFSVATFVFFDVMLNPAARAGKASTTPLVVTLSLFAFFGIVSVAFNRYFAYRHRGVAEPADVVMSTATASPLAVRAPLATSVRLEPPEGPTPHLGR